MGHYTCYRADFIVRSDTPAAVVGILKYLLGLETDQWGNSAYLQVEQFNHPFFATYRWDCIGFFGGGMEPQGRVAVEDRLTQTDNGDYRVRIVSSTKGAEEDLALLLHWLHPWLVLTNPRYPVLDGAALLGVAQYEDIRSSGNGPARLVVADAEGIIDMRYVGERYEREDFKGIEEIEEGFDVIVETLDDVKLNLVTGDRGGWRLGPDDPDEHAIYHRATQPPVGS